ncbi:hypothetical protein HGRIS_013979 [Hohenbuehelia grisea]|uniref:Uncharacterized protein n=1 Tax=Hohenbuehelia grisea TaxID=104357 RepID=A0ABR3JSY4_9AGAR
MSDTTTVEVQRRMQLATDTTEVPPVQKKRGCEGPIWIPLRVCGFLYTYEDLVAYAEKNLPDDFDVDAKAKKRSISLIRDCRRQTALRHIKKLLNKPHYAVVRLANGDIETCMLVGSNYDEKDLSNASDPAVLDKFRKALDLDSSRQPRWYRLGRELE